jgi:hypothetical protein
MPDLLDECRQREYQWNRPKNLRAKDYAVARIRAKRSWHQAIHSYEDALHLAATLTRRRDERTGLEEEFHALVESWKEETGHLSSLTKAFANPKYLRIIALSKKAKGHELERLLLRELSSDPDHWFAALAAITGQDPVMPEHDFDQAVNAWLRWGHSRGII